MKILMDTHILLWALTGDSKLSEHIDELSSPDNKVYFSTASIWEVAIKYGKGKLPTPPEEVCNYALSQKYSELSITSEHTIATTGLRKPEGLAHSDPFDCILLAQAKCEGMTLYTSDRKLAQYDEPGVLHVIL